jgi:hypothetical protein
VAFLGLPEGEDVRGTSARLVEGFPEERRDRPDKWTAPVRSGLGLRQLRGDLTVLGMCSVVGSGEVKWRERRGCESRFPGIGGWA